MSQLATISQAHQGADPAGLGTAWTIGPTSSGADIEINDALVRPRHALLTVDGSGRWWITPDQGGLVHVNGTQIREMTALDPASVIVVGQTTITIAPELMAASMTVRPGQHGDGQAHIPVAPVCPSDREGGLYVELDHVSVTAKDGTALLDDLSLRIEGGTVVAVVGPSGAGKSSLAKLLVGDYQHDVGGRVLIGLPGAGSRPRREQIRYVPQSSSSHLYPELTVRETLTYAAQVRALADIPLSIEKRVAKVIASLGLENQWDKPIGDLSGGQRLRVSIGVELVGYPQLLILDEPTSGLDLGKDGGIMRDLRKISDELRCTVIIVTHTTTHLPGIVDKVIVMDGAGRMAYDGPPPDLTDREWAPSMEVLDRQVRRPPADTVRSREATLSSSWRGWVSLTGFGTALRRQLLLVKRRGLQSLAALFTLPLVGTVLAILAAPSGLRPTPEMHRVLAILVTVASLTGSSLTYLELVHERDVLQRDHRVGVSAASLLAAKTAVFGGICAVMAAVMTMLFDGWRELPPQFYGLPPAVMIFVVMFGVMASSMAVGMLISAASSTLERAVTVNAFFAVFQVVINGSLFHLDNRFLQTFSEVLPARLGFAAVASAADLNHYAQAKDALWEHTRHQFGMLLLGTAAIFTVAITMAILIMELRWRGRSLWRQQR
ncbi:ATP-binding cassette domain-containing protein [Nonomuraea sp. NPDC003707]